MWRFTAATVLATLIGVAALSIQTTPVHACSTSEDFDPVAESDLIIAGRMLGFEIIEKNVVDTEPAEQDKGKGNVGSGFSRIQVEMTVETIYKGALEGPTITLTEGRSLVVYDHEPFHVWAGSSGSCGAFNSDPTGTYAILGLNRGDDGTYSPHLPLGFFMGEGPDDPGYEGALERMASFPAAASLSPKLPVEALPGKGAEPYL